MRRQIVIFSLLAFIQFVSSQSENLHQGPTLCLRSENVPSNSTYNTNILSLLSNLTSLSSHSLFSNISSGSGLDRVNGLYLCRPDLPLETCHACVIDAIATRLLPLFACATRKQAIVFYEECMVRYSNRSIFATVETKVNLNTTCGFFKVSQPEVFPTLLNRTMEGLITEAISSPAGRQVPYFAFGNASFTVFEGLFGMVLCTPDITSDECRHCLETAMGLIPSCGAGLSQFTMVFLPSCHLRYDTAPFIFPPSPSVLAPAPALSD